MSWTKRTAAPAGLGIPVRRGKPCVCPPVSCETRNAKGEHKVRPYIMQRSHLIRNLALFLASGAWCFLLLAYMGFSPTDWPSHAVDPYPPIHNLCGTVG